MVVIAGGSVGFVVSLLVNENVGAAFGVIMAIVGVYQDDCIAGDDR